MDPSDSSGPTERCESASVAALGAALDLAAAAGEPLLVGVSGGSDSVALAGLAARARPGRIALVHVDHGVRPGAAADAAFVLELARQLDLPCRVERPSPPTRTSETSLRALRLAALGRAARDHGARLVLLAHHGDDTRETILLHALRGHRGLRARAGMPAWRPLDAQVGLLRPWLLLPRPPGRAELARARRGLGLPHVEDPSNADPGIPRNRVRALLAEARAPLTHARLEGLRLQARARLQRVLAALCLVLEQALQAEGHGVRLDAWALQPPPGLGVDATSWRTELLRLLGACLQPTWRPQLSRGVLEQLEGRLAAARASGALSLPGRPGALGLRLSPAGLHLRDVRLHPGDGPERSLAALGRTPLP